MGGKLSMRTKRIALLAVLVLIVIAVVAVLIFTLKSVKTGAGSEREITLTFGWNGQDVNIPAPVEFPEWAEGTWEYKLWRWKKDARTFTILDREGYKYVADGQGFQRDKNGRLYGAFGGIKRYRPDGKLEAATTSILSGNVPVEWVTFNDQGKRIIRVYAHIKDDGRSYEVIFYNDDGKMAKEWYTNTKCVIYSEQARGPDGRYHFTHRLKELKDSE